MRTAVLVAIVVFILLFVLTTFPQSPTARQRAIAEDFTAQEIDEGWQLALQRKLIFWSTTFISLGFFGWLVLSGQARRLADRFERWTGRRWLWALLLMAAFCFLAETTLLFPLRVISLENWRAWGMTQRSFLDWLLEYAKATALSAGIGLVLLVVLYALLRWLPRWWWLPATAGTVLFAIAYAYVLPLWINPLFNTFTPLEDPELNRRIHALAAKAGVPVQEVLVMDASRQGSHTNAYFTGFGSSRRIVLYDTLIKSHPPAEIESILAHEIGHWQHNHIAKGIALGGLGALAGFWLLSVALRWAVQRPPFYLHSPADPAGWPLIILLGLLASWAVLPVESAVSRYFERQADRTSLELAGQPEIFIAAEKRLVRDNKSNLIPAPLSVWLFASHPPAVERIDMARQWEKRRQ